MTRSVVDGAFALLGAFSAERPTLGVTELSRRAGLPLTTTHRLVAQLVARGALERTGDGGYRVGLRLWEIGSLAPRSTGLRERALPYLEDLYEATHQNVQLAVLDGDEAVYVERLSGHDAVRVISRSGGRLPLHATGVGLVLLAFADPVVQERVLAGPLPGYSPRTVTDPAELRRVLADVRRARVAIVDGAITVDALSVAAPVTAGGPGEPVIAALSVVAPSEHPAQQYVTAVRAAAHGISRSI